MDAEVVIERRFRGPPESANGGYACGLVAGLLGGVAEVTLRLPPPLDRELDVVRADGELVEIQTGGFSALRTKLDALLDRHRIRIVHPIPAERRIVRVWPRSPPIGTAPRNTSGGLMWCC